MKLPAGVVWVLLALAGWAIFAAMGLGVYLVVTGHWPW